MKKSAAGFAIAAAMLAACHQTPAAPQPAPSPAAVQPPPAAPPPATEHTVTIRVTGPPGSVFRVTGAVFGNTGLIDMPATGSDSASFTTTQPDDLGLSVSIMPGTSPRSCAIEVDGKQTITQSAATGDTELVCASTRAA